MVGLRTDDPGLGDATAAAETEFDLTMKIRRYDPAAGTMLGGRSRRTVGPGRLILFLSLVLFGLLAFFWWLGGPQPQEMVDVPVADGVLIR